ncbi:hypothetical protein V474_25310 [Novosphingobium barchaimii LL02]|uniref:Uncharacterized protein n=2 Tax=Novosphingobium barchaimii TaxID=1420591 RepID=A0A0J7XMU1_9SPHN|nr:hypothetical protein V474_25310 [Novosphingobium barchaimii LL02]
MTNRRLAGVTSISRAEAERAPIRRQVSDDAVPPHLLRDTARTAGMFQRSVLGHMDHKEWLGRVRADGQRLMDLLSEMGFNPSEARGDTGS